MSMGFLALAYAGAVYRARRTLKALSADMVAGNTATIATRPSAARDDGEEKGEVGPEEDGEQGQTDVFVSRVAKALLTVDNSAV